MIFFIFITGLRGYFGAPCNVQISVRRVRRKCLKIIFGKREVVWYREEGEGRREGRGERRKGRKERREGVGGVEG